MKKIPKKLLDDCIEACRAFWGSGNKCLLFPMHEKAETLGKAIGLDGFVVSDFISCIAKGWGFCPDAENEKIYSVLRVLGWEVVNDAND